MTDNADRPFHPNPFLNYVMEGSAWVAADMMPDPMMTAFLQKQLTARQDSEESAPPRPSPQSMGAKLLRKIGF